MFWCCISLVVLYIACCCLDGDDLKPKWRFSLAFALRKIADKAFPIVDVEPETTVIGASVEISEFDLANPVFRQPHNRERLLRECEVRIADGISRELLRRNLISFKQDNNAYGGIRKVGSITICNNENI